MTFAVAGWALSPPCPRSSQLATPMPSSASQRLTRKSSSPGMDHQDQSRGINVVLRCEKEISQLPKPLERSLRRHRKKVAEDGVKVEEDNIRILSWNILSQGDTQKVSGDKFSSFYSQLSGPKTMDSSAVLQRLWNGRQGDGVSWKSLFVISPIFSAYKRWSNQSASSITLCDPCFFTGGPFSSA